ncbi:MAG: hypothetical protein OER22_06920 [Gammaproteobacteria bacterium]|nr:hypothetical protein [Gammaproteobacteria bacterium]MDH3373323.1 hypothetical protein [Gammaproteobacteria bacterium]MDH3408162.1 hypothetical protein [Gammaproteobacteria bacterium]MDH3552330.1 hypothetical protein [Gammaproteobacteria bacterium]
MTENFFDVLGVLTAFITVMLIFSIAITSLVQATQGLFRWRGRNLQNGLAKILRSVRYSEKTDESSKNAISLINGADSSLISSVFDPQGWPARIFGPQLSWMDPEQLDKELRKNQLNLDDDQISKVSERFRNSQGAMRKIFLRRIRMATIAWAFAIAFYYQLSAPQLLQDFSTDPKLRAAAERTADKLLEGADRATDGQQDPVAYFQIAPWREEWKFYYEPGDGQRGSQPLRTTAREGFDFRHVQYSNIIGVLITVVLLSMGAPFWFDMLKKVANLRDILGKATDGDEAAKKGDKSREQGLIDDRIALLRERVLSTSNPLVRASLQKEINDLRLVKAGAK